MKFYSRLINIDKNEIKSNIIRLSRPRISPKRRSWSWNNNRTLRSSLITLFSCLWLRRPSPKWRSKNFGAPLRMFKPAILRQRIDSKAPFIGARKPDPGGCAFSSSMRISQSLSNSALIFFFFSRNARWFWWTYNSDLRSYVQQSERNWNFVESYKGNGHGSSQLAAGFNREN